VVEAAPGTGSRPTFDTYDWDGGCKLYVGSVIWVTVTEPTLAGRGWLLVCDDCSEDRTAGTAVWLVVNTVVAVGFDTELFVRLLVAAPDGSDAGEADVAAATPITGNAWLLTFTYNACGRTELSDADGDIDTETSALLVLVEMPLHWDDVVVSLARVSRQGRFGSAL